MKKLHDFDEVFDTQQTFRLLLDAMANPTRTVDIRPSAAKFHTGERPLLAIGMTLLDNEVAFHVVGDEALAGELRSLTLARYTDAAQADYVFAKTVEDVQAVIPQLKCGTLRDPHISATLILLDSAQGSHPMVLCGPGIDGTVAYEASDLAYAAITMRDQQCYEYPQGIDLLLVSGGGDLHAIPRLTRREVR